jgi:hypothetical protein
VNLAQQKDIVKIEGSKMPAGTNVILFIIPKEITQAEVATIIKTIVTMVQQEDFVKIEGSKMPAGTNVKNVATQKENQLVKKP